MLYWLIAVQITGQVLQPLEAIWFTKQAQEKKPISDCCFSVRNQVKLILRRLPFRLGIENMPTKLFWSNSREVSKAKRIRVDCRIQFELGGFQFGEHEDCHLLVHPQGHIKNNLSHMQILFDPVHPGVERREERREKGIEDLPSTVDGRALPS